MASLNKDIRMLKSYPNDAMNAEVYVDGVKEDFQTLFDHFIECDSVRYEQFSQIWREMKIPLIFWGRLSNIENIKFTLECYKIALEFLDGVSDFQIEIGVLYLLYGIYNTQLSKPKQKIRLAMRRWKRFQELHEKLQEGEHLDALYIFHSLVAKKCFHFFATNKEQIFETAVGRRRRRADLELYKDPDEDDKSLLHDLMESETSKHLRAVHEHYYKMKCQLAGPIATEPEKSLDIIDSKLLNNIDKVLDEYNKYAAFGSSSRRKQHDSESVEEPEISALHTSRKAIRQKAFGGKGETARKDRRHRIVVSSGNESTKSPKVGRKKQKRSDKKGANEPVPGPSAAADEAADILSMPLVIFDDDGNRLGERLPGSKKTQQGKGKKRGSDSSGEEWQETKPQKRKQKTTKKKTSKKSNTSSIDDLEQKIKKKLKKKNNDDEMWEDIME